jgi:3-hydroxybutyryl-CoA dehydratase
MSSRGPETLLQPRFPPLVESPVESCVENGGKSSPRRVRPFESFELGETHRSPVRTVEQDEVRRFADLTGDRNPIHLDPVFARQTVFRGTIAHGLLLASILAGMAYDRGLLGKNILALESSSERYLAPVRPGDRVYGTVRIAEVDGSASKRCGRVVWDLKLHRVVADQPDETVVEATWSTLVFKDRYLKA